MTTADGTIRLLMELRSQGVSDMAVLKALEQTPRDGFVSADQAERAWENTALPIGCGQTISQPIVVGLMTQKLDLGERMRVLEVGTGSGYQAAILARLVRRVYTVERHADLLREAHARFESLKLHNITTRRGDGSRGWPEQAPFDRIMVTAAAETMPEALIEQLAPGGIMVVPVGTDTWDQKLYRVERTEDGYDSVPFLDVRFVPLVVESRSA
ncbi:MAG: protein-L-isoaspartate O-methyltransferase [Rhodospirillaceae bacterium]|nr:protein-L-isoaspartate O-methyltransferase [Rhodospirillaceae bacterium]|tara:strand:+ start:2252 stop:2890 length:639 start_codon:yes stop_codon:yes gene_type:complete